MTHLDAQKTEMVCLEKHMRFVWITADVTFLCHTNMGSECKVTERYDAHVSLKIAFFNLYESGVFLVVVHHLLVFTMSFIL